jgi:hypothetical protein
MSAADIPATDAISSSEHSGDGLPRETVNEKNISMPARPKANRATSEWEALQIAEAGDLDTIDREVAEIEADLQAMNIRSTWYKPQLKLSDPRYFTWLLVSFASMGGLLSGIDQSLISGANLYMPKCELKPSSSWSCS